MFPLEILCAMPMFLSFDALLWRHLPKKEME